MSNKIVREGEFWVIYQAGFPLARSKNLEVLTKRWPDTPVVGGENA